MAKYLTHSNPEQLDLQLDDHWFRIPPEDPFEVESTFYFDKLMEIYGPVYGLVELVVTKSRAGISIDMEQGAKDARKALKSSYMRAVRNYVDDQLVDRVRKGLPALPPMGRASLAITELKIDLKKRYGFSPIDWEGEEAELHVPGTVPQAAQQAIQPAPANNAKVEFLEAQIAKSNRIMTVLAKQLGVDLADLEDDALAAEGQAAAAKPKGRGNNKPKDTEPVPAVEA